MSEDSPLGLLEKFKEIDAYETLVNERILFILNREIGLAPYTHEFIPSRRDSQIMSGFISALSNYMSEMTGQQAPQWKTVYGPDSTMIVENGTWASGVISVARDTIETRSKLKKVVAEFEETFQFLRDAAELEGSLFAEFDNFVRRVFTADRISERTLIYKVTEDPSAFRPTLPSIKFKIVKFLENAVDWQSVAEAAVNQGIDLDETIEIVSQAYWGGAISLLHVPSDYDVLMPSAEALTVIFNPSNPTGISYNTLRVVGALDGRIPLIQLIRELGIQGDESILLELGYLLNKGLLQRISVEERFALIAECIGSHFFKTISEHIGNDNAASLFDSIVKEGISQFPWIAFLKLTSDNHIIYPRVPGLTPNDIDGITDAIEYMVQEVSNNLSELISSETAENLLRNARKSCEAKYQNLLQNIIV
ncbi:MAG: hypothetical protein K9W43_11320 [Candidatus Thorarchaeota archaeon]|nr:hypothetical protein [Candidatus Thorarchaeota archaeon]